MIFFVLTMMYFFLNSAVVKAQHYSNRILKQQENSRYGPRTSENEKNKRLIVPCIFGPGRCANSEYYFPQIISPYFLF